MKCDLLAGGGAIDRTVQAQQADIEARMRLHERDPLLGPAGSDAKIGEVDAVRAVFGRDHPGRRDRGAGADATPSDAHHAERIGRRDGPIDNGLLLDVRELFGVPRLRGATECDPRRGHCAQSNPEATTSLSERNTHEPPYIGGRRTSAP